MIASKCRRGSIRPATAGLALLLFLVGCSGQSAPQEVDSQTVRAASVLTAFPSEVSIAQAILVQDCVKSAGFDMPFDSGGAKTPPLSFGISNIFSSVEEAQRVGYTTTTAEGGDVLSQWESALSASQRDRYFEVLLGPEDADEIDVELSNGTVMTTGTQGCLAEAKTDLYGSVEAELAFNALVNEYLAAVSGTSNDRDARLAELAPEFERCMDDQGYTVEGFGVQSLAEELFGAYRAPGEPPSAAEQELATADYLCQEKADLRDVIAESFAQGASEWIGANEGKLIAMQEELELVKERAVTVING